MQGFLFRFKKSIMTLSCLGLVISKGLFAFTAYSNKELDELEKQFKQEINSSPQVIRTPLASNYINRLAGRLASQGNMAKPYFFIVSSREINAFAGPGGYIGVNTQLILTSDTESELAAVMAHEMAHVRQHHLYRMIERQKGMQIPKMASMLAAIALGAINPVLASGAIMGTLTGFEQDTINFIRSNEKEADSIGMSMLTKANFDPEGMPLFFKKMQLNSRYYYSDNIPAILRTHPLDEDRIAEADNRIAQLKSKPHEQSSPNYYFFKELIRHEVKHDPQQTLVYYQKECRQHSPDFACRYGEALSLQEGNQNTKAISLLEPLASSEFQHNPFVNLALAKAYEDNRQNDKAKAIYQEFNNFLPNNNAVIDQYTDYLKENNPKQALSILLKAHRQHSEDPAICIRLARVQAELHKTAEAYFTEANCHLIIGEKKAAITQLNIAKRYAKPNSYIYQRIIAKMDELKD
jgi:predicted Zn-dependent protease